MSSAAWARFGVTLLHKTTNVLQRLQEQKLAVSVALGILLITFPFLNYAQLFQEFCLSLNNH